MRTGQQPRTGAAPLPPALVLLFSLSLAACTPAAPPPAAAPTAAQPTTAAQVGGTSTSVATSASEAAQKPSTALAPGSAGAAKPRAKVVITQALAPGSPGSAPYYIGGPLGYWDEENLDVEVQSLAGGASRGIDLVLAGQADSIAILPDGLLVPTSQGRDLGMVWVYGIYQRPTHQLAVAADGDITDVRQLRGKTVGMSALGPPSETFLDAWLTSVGVDPQEVNKISVGNSPAAAEALKTGQVQAMVQSSAELTSFAIRGYNFRWFPYPPDLQALFGAGFLVKKDLSLEKRDAMARYLRAFTKSIVFGRENPEAAVRIMWDLFPAAVPKSQDEATAVKEAARVVKVFVDVADKAPDGRWGFIAKERWQAYVKYLGLQDKIASVDNLIDYQMLDTVNQFDEAGVREQARNYKHQ